ncbi:hypothetical protein BASA81_002135 [Batrachochytrium salamandrivorans]|nr:hypothetical protein BASA81_002135 [Batrachochytrium salamandrivorans]
MSVIAKCLDSNEWHYTDTNETGVGPVTIEDMRKALANGTLMGEAYVWHPVGVPEWTVLDDLPELKQALAPPNKPKVVAARPPIAVIQPSTARPQVAEVPAAAEVKPMAAAGPVNPLNAAILAKSGGLRPAAGGATAPAVAPRAAPAVALRSTATAAAAPAVAPRAAPAVAPRAQEAPAAAPRAVAAAPGAPAVAPRAVAAAPVVAAASKPAVAGRPSVIARPAASTTTGAAPGKKLGKLGGRSVGNWTEMSTADGVFYYHNTATGELTWDKPNEMKDASELVSETGKFVWVCDPIEAFVLANLKERRPDGRCDVVIERTGESLTTKKGEPVYDLFSKSSLKRTERDLVLLDSLDEALILHNLKERFTKQRQIYTNIGTILISINPYETYPIYSKENIDNYRNRGNRVLDPHVFTVADEALTPILETSGVPENHSILISGESGAGKTWNTKQALSYLTDVTSKGNTNESNVEARILAANPILEGFGNAKTIRNDNSSRFGRFTEVHLDKSGRITGSRIENFLLEKSRVVWQAENERNYHVFYQLAKTPTWGTKYGIQKPQDFFYLSKTAVYNVPDVDDLEDFQAMLQAFEEMGLTGEEIDWVMRLVAGVLHIGNVTFQESGEGSNLTKVGSDSMSHVAKCLQVDQSGVEFGFTHRSIEVNKTVTNIPLKPHDAESSRDALAKSIYGSLFDWLVGRVNFALTGGVNKSPWAFIGLLDIFGFEIFKINSFEQLCINFTNEKLQQLFNRDTFQKEQAMYRKEGVQFEEIVFIDNQPILDMIEKKAGGLLATLDDLNRMPKSTDEQFVSKADETNARSDYYITSTMTKKGKTSFTIRHYAGDVIYDAKNFLQKNKDLLYADLYDVMTASTHERTSAMFPPMDKNERSKFSLGFQFRNQLDKLMNQLNQTQTHYIRCIKPNNDKRPSELDPVLTLEQLRYSGVFEAVRIRKQGFPFRYTYERFVERYKCLMLQDAKWVSLKSKTAKDQVREILTFTGQDFSQLQYGASMVLYRSEQYRLLELLRALSLEKVCALIQAIGRGMIARAYMRRFRGSLPRLEKAKESRDPDTIDKALADYSRIVGGFQNMIPVEPAIVRSVKRLRFALKEWERLAVECSDLSAVDLTQDDATFEMLKDCVWNMDLLMDEPGSEWHMQTYEYGKYQFETERARRMEPLLVNAMNMLERDLMSEVYAECKRLKFEDDRLREIEKFVGMGEDDLLKFQYRNAKKLGLADRARAKEIKIREGFLDTHMDMFQFERFPRLRDPEEFAHASIQFWKREELAANMLKWTKNHLIKTSLTILDDPLLVKAALQIHRAILGWCGERSNPSPNSLAHEIAQHGISSLPLRDEIYAQLMKQLNGNESPQSVAQAWKLFALCIQCFPPNRDFSDYLLVFFRTNAMGQMKTRFRDALYDIEYAGAISSPPTIDSIPSKVAGW